MRFLKCDRDVGSAVAAIAIVGHARLAATPFDQLAMTIALDVGRAALRVVRHAAERL